MSDWRKKSKEMTMGKYARPKQNEMVLLTFISDPTVTRGENFNKEEVDELQFPVLYYETRPVGNAYEKGEAAKIINTTKGQNKILPVQGGPLLRAITEEDEAEDIIGRSFIIRHTGASQNTVYKFIEVKVAKTIIKPLIDDEEEEDEEPETSAEEESQMSRHPRKDAPKKPTRANRATIKVPEDDPESIKPKFDGEGKEIVIKEVTEEAKDKAKFMKEVEKKTKDRKKKAVSQDPPDEPVECDPREDEGEE
jgi:hypothetical protein